jgi:hypothetical protein
VSDPDEDEGDGLPPDGGSIQDFFADACARTFNLKVKPVDNLTVTARVVTPDGENSFVIAEGANEGNGVDLPIGSEVHVQAEDGEWFSGWYAEGTLLTGSSSPSDSFILTQDTEVVGIIKGSQQLAYQETDSVKIVAEVAGGDDPLELARGESYFGYRFINFRSGTHLSLRAVSTNASDLGVIVSGDYYHTTTTTTAASRVASIDYLTASVTGGSSPHGTGTISATISDGYAALGFPWFEYPGFIGQLVYPLPDPAVGSWTMDTNCLYMPDPGYYIYSATYPVATKQDPNPTGEAETRQMYELTIAPPECFVFDCDINNHGTVALKNAHRFYEGPTATRANGELVGISSNPDHFHDLRGFKVSEGVRVYTTQQQEVNYFSLQGMQLIEPDGDGVYRTQGEIFVEMSEDAEVTPVYQLQRPGALHTSYPNCSSPREDVWVTDCQGKELALGCSGTNYYIKYDGEVFGECPWPCGINRFLHEYIGDRYGTKVLWVGFHSVTDDPCVVELDEEGTPVRICDEETPDRMDWESQFWEFHVSDARDYSGVVDEDVCDDEGRKPEGFTVEDFGWVPPWLRWPQVWKSPLEDP